MAICSQELLVGSLKLATVDIFLPQKLTIAKNSTIALWFGCLFVCLRFDVLT